MHKQDIFNKINKLPADKLAVVEDFVEFLQYRSNADTLIKGMHKLSEQSFQKVWDNPDDADYDNL